MKKSISINNQMIKMNIIIIIILTNYNKKKNLKIKITQNRIVKNNKFLLILAIMAKITNK